MIHSDNPQLRLVRMAVDALKKGAVIIYPTDSSYALGCRVGDKKAMDRMRQIRKLDKRHQFSLMCRDLSEISLYAKVSNTTFRFLKAHTPGAYTFILPATLELPKRLQNPKRKTIGIRVPDCNITQMILEALGEPLLTTSLIHPGDKFAISDPDEIYDRYHGQVPIFIDGGNVGIEQTTVVDLTDEIPNLVRQGKGPIGVEFEV